MGIPYLENGESILLTAGRVSVNHIHHDVLLTSRNLILVDDRYGEFQPRIVPLFNIQSVKGGKTSSREPAISLYLADTTGTGDPGPMVFIFSQQAGENRTRERDDWLKKLMEFIVSVRQRAGDNEITLPDQEIGIRPSTRHTEAPEIPHPYTTIIDMRPAQIDPVVLPDEPEIQVFPEEKQELKEEDFLHEGAEEGVMVSTFAGEEPPSGPEERTESPVAVPVRVPDNDDTTGISDQTPGSADAIPAFEGDRPGSGGGVEAPPAVSPRETEFTAVNGTHEEDYGVQESFADSPSAEPFHGKDSPLADPASPPVPIPERVSAEARDSTESTDSGSIPEETESGNSIVAAEAGNDAEIISEDTRVEQTSAGEREDIGSRDLPHIPEPIFIEPGSGPNYDSAQEEVTGPKPGNIEDSDQNQVPETPLPVPGPVLPMKNSGNNRFTFIAIAVIILIVLGIAWAVIVSVPDGAIPGITPVPTPGTQQTPGPAPSLQPSPVPANVVIPSSGVWVRVLYQRNYTGLLGVPGSLREVAGSGDQIYKIFEPANIVQAQVHKQDNSGDMLTVEVYREGDLISHRTISTPMGSIEFMIDARTGQPPGIPVTPTPLNNQGGSNSSGIMYF
jgi:hypothetical protein